MANLTDSDLMEMGVKRKRSFSWPAVLLVITLAAAGGFVVAMYLPLQRAHDRIEAEYLAQAPKLAELRDALNATKAELEKVDKRREELQDQEDARKSAKDAGKAAFKELKTTLANELAKPIFKKDVTVLYGPTRVRVKLKGGLMKPNTTELTGDGKATLCKAAKAIQAKDKLVVAVIGHTKGDKAAL